MKDYLRTQKMIKKYEKYKAAGLMAYGCGLCKEKKLVVKKFKHWKIMVVLFPYDLLAKTHHMIVPNRHVVYEKLNGKEKKEFILIKKTYIEQNYDHILESLNKGKSIPGHFHIHLIVDKK